MMSTKKSGDKVTTRLIPATVAEEDEDESTLLAPPGQRSVVVQEAVTVADVGEAEKNCFGVKSYLHQFYDARDDMASEDIVEDDDFEYLVEPGKRRARWCYWFRWCIWCGANLLLIGIITLLVGHLTPKREVVVDVRDHLEVLDRWAITFNQRLEFCRVAGLVIFFFGGLIVFAALLASTCITSDNHGDTCCCYERRDVTTTTTLMTSYSEEVGGVGKIPISEQIKSVQPQLEEAGVGAGVVLQMPYY